MSTTTPAGVIGVIGVIGVGKLGTALTRPLLAAGREVLVAGSGDPERFSLVAEVLLPGARPGHAREVVQASDVVVLALPFGRIPELVEAVSPSAFAGKVVVDATNHWEPVDGPRPAFAPSDVPTSVAVARLLPAARVTKAFSHVGYHDLEEWPRPAGDPDRRAVAVAGAPEDVAEVLDLVETIGFDAIHLGPLEETREMEAGGRLFGAPLRRAA